MTTNDKTPLPPKLKRKVVITSLLKEGWHAARIAKHLKISRQAVAKHIKRISLEQGLVKVSLSPAHYQKKLTDNPPLMAQPSDNQQTIMPHHYGAKFAVLGKLKTPLDLWGKWHEVKPTHAIQLGKYKCSIWIKAFNGISPKEIRENAIERMKGYAKYVEDRHQIKLELMKVDTNIEWAMVSQTTSDKIAESIGLAKEEARIVDNTIHKNGDASHTTIEFIPLKDYPTNPTKHADAHHFVYSGELAKTLEAIGDAVISINQRLMQMEKKR